MEVPIAMGRPKATLVLDAELREQLESLANSRSLPAGLVRRAKIILLSASGKTNREIARQLETSKVTVGLWRRRFLAQGVSGLYEELRRGRPRPSDERVAQLIRKTLKSKPKGATHWSLRQLADETGISKSTVHRIWQAFGVQPHRQKHFKLSNDPFFVEKVRDIVGLYLNAPENAVVLCVDKKSGIQALERTQPMLPLGLGYVEGVTHDYRRHGTITLFAALERPTAKCPGNVDRATGIRSI
jgi:transposase